MIPRMIDEIVNRRYPLKRVACYLSGGIDSSIVLYHLTKTDAIVDTYTLSFGVSTDETAKAKRVADYFKVNNTVVPLTNFLETLPEIMKLFEHPRYNVWPWWLAKKASEDGHNVAYIGEGSDEVFGYPDRGYLEGWAGQLIYVYPTFITCNEAFNLQTIAPFMEFHNELLHLHGLFGPAAYYKPPLKTMLRMQYDELLPEWILTSPAHPPAITSYPEFGLTLNLTGNVRKQLQLAATKAWLEVHDVPETDDRTNQPL